MKTAFTVFFIVLFCIVNVAIADNIDKAEKLIVIERYDAAHNLIETEIINDPENANNFYRAGILYLRMGWDTQASRSFDFATLLDKTGKYKQKVSKIYQAQAYIAINKGETKSAKRLFAKAHKLNQDMKNADTKDLLRYGTDYLQRRQEKKAYSYFLTAIAIDPTLGDTISDIYYQACENIKRPCFAYYRRCQEFSDKNTVKIVTLLTSLYKTKGISQEWKWKLKGEVKHYVSRAEFKRLFPPPPPDYKIYPPGTYTIILKAGETTDHWIMFPAGAKHSYNLSSSDNKFKVSLNDGRTFKAWQISKAPYQRRGKFKLTAVTDQKITLTVN